MASWICENREHQTSRVRVGDLAAVLNGPDYSIVSRPKISTLLLASISLNRGNPCC
ncbi:hypothetical protein BDV98DRAFT_561742, partial [Pterulicium gracile]